MTVASSPTSKVDPMTRLESESRSKETNQENGSKAASSEDRQSQKELAKQSWNIELADGSNDTTTSALNSEDGEDDDDDSDDSDDGINNNAVTTSTTAFKAPSDVGVTSEIVHYV